MTTPAKRGPGQPRLVPGERTETLRVRIAEGDRALVADAAADAGQHVTAYMREAAIERAAKDLGLDLALYLETRERRRAE